MRKSEWLLEGDRGDGDVNGSWQARVLGAQDQWAMEIEGGEEVRDYQRKALIFYRRYILSALLCLSAESGWEAHRFDNTACLCSITRGAPPQMA